MFNLVSEECGEKQEPFVERIEERFVPKNEKVTLTPHVKHFLTLNVERCSRLGHQVA